MHAIKTSLTILASLLYLTTLAQVKFEPGYMVDNEGKKSECLIENKDWVYTPKSFQYKLSDSDQPTSGTVATIREFGVYNYSRFIRASVQLDTSSTMLNKLDTSKKPAWAAKTIFLKVIVKGSANLYSYQTADHFKFFISTSSDSSIRQLVYKEYYITSSKVGQNIDFRQQLFAQVNCGNIPTSHFENLDYKEPELKKHFTTYNTCMGDEVVLPVARPSAKAPTRDLLNVKVTPGVSYSSLSVTNSLNRYRNVAFDNNFFFRGGLEIEYILPFNKNKWGIFFEPTYQYFKGSELYDTWSTATINYHSIEFPLGFRYYIFLKNGSKVFINAIYLPGGSKKLSDAEITYGSTRTAQTFVVEIKTIDSFSFGGGYAKGPLSLEARYYIPQNLLNSYTSYHAPYQRLTFIAGFKFLKLKSKVRE